MLRGSQMGWLASGWMGRSDSGWVGVVLDELLALGKQG